MSSEALTSYQLKFAVWGDKSPSSLHCSACMKRSFCVFAACALTPTFPAHPPLPQAPFAGALGLLYQFLSSCGVWCGMGPPLCVASLAGFRTPTTRLLPLHAHSSCGSISRSLQFLYSCFPATGSCYSRCALLRPGIVWLVCSSLRLGGPMAVNAASFSCRSCVHPPHLVPILCPCAHARGLCDAL
jgi:hypothetical protein